METYVEIICGFVAVFLAFYYYFTSTFDFWKARGVPGPRPIPLFGNMKDIIFRKVSLCDYTKDIYTEYKDEPMIGMYLWRTPVLLLRDRELIKDVLIRDFSNFADRGFPVVEKVEPLSQHLFNLEAERWRPMRAKLMPIFSSGKLKEMFPLILECSKNLEQYLDKLVSTGEPVECRQLTGKFTTSVIGSCAFGIELSSLYHQNSQFCRLSSQVFRLGLRFRLREMVPKFYNLLGYLFPEKEMTTYFTKLIVDVMAHRENNNIFRPDVVNMLLDLKKNADKLDTIELTDTLLTAQAFVFLIAGFETSSTTMTHALYELALNVDVQKKLRQEIKEHYEKNNGELKYDDIKNMAYLDLVFRETLRKYPPGPLILRRSLADYTFRNTKVTIPGKSFVWIPLFATHRDPDNYPNPEAFIPERFTEDAVAARHPTQYLPFGDGPRNCIGARFATCESKVGLIAILRNYKVEACDKTMIPYAIDPASFLLAPKGGIYLKFTKDCKTRYYTVIVKYNIFFVCKKVQIFFQVIGSFDTDAYYEISRFSSEWFKFFSDKSGAIFTNRCIYPFLLTENIICNEHMRIAILQEVTFWIVLLRRIAIITSLYPSLLRNKYSVHSVIHSVKSTISHSSDTHSCDYAYHMKSTSRKYGVFWAQRIAPRFPEFLKATPAAARAHRVSIDHPREIASNTPTTTSSLASHSLKLPSVGTLTINLYFCLLFHSGAEFLLERCRAWTSRLDDVFWIYVSVSISWLFMRFTSNLVDGNTTALHLNIALILIIKLELKYPINNNNNILLFTISKLLSLCCFTWRHRFGPTLIPDKRIYLFFHRIQYHFFAFREGFKFEWVLMFAGTVDLLERFFMFTRWRVCSQTDGIFSKLIKIVEKSCSEKLEKLRSSTWCLKLIDCFMVYFVVYNEDFIVISNKVENEDYCTKVFPCNMNLKLRFLRNYIRISIDLYFCYYNPCLYNQPVGNTIITLIFPQKLMSYIEQNNILKFTRLHDGIYNLLFTVYIINYVHGKPNFRFLLYGNTFVQATLKYIVQNNLQSSSKVTITVLIFHVIANYNKICIGTIKKIQNSKKNYGCDLHYRPWIATQEPPKATLSSLYDNTDTVITKGFAIMHTHFCIATKLTKSWMQCKYFLRHPEKIESNFQRMETYVEIICGFVAVFLAFYYYFISTFDFWKVRGVPGPRPIPVFGNVKDTMFLKMSPAHLVRDVYNKYKDEPMVGIFTWRTPILILRDPELIKDVLIRDFSNFMDRGFANVEKAEPLSPHLFNLEPERWRLMRAKLSPIFTSGKLKTMFPLIIDCSKHLEKYFEKLVSKGEPIDCREVTAKFTTNVIGSCAFGIEFNALCDEESEFRRKTRQVFVLSLSQIIRLRLKEMVPTFYNLLGYVFPEKEMTTYFTKLFMDTMAYRKENNINRHDFVNMLLELKENAPKIDTIELTDTLLTAQAFAFLAAGYETSSAAISHTLYELALNVDVQEKLRQEIKEHFEKNNGELKYDDIKKMTYLNLVLSETMRKYPAAAFFVRKSQDDYTFRNTKVTIPKETLVWVPVYGLHNDPDIYPNPDAFIPERFTDDAVAARHPMYYLPFGDGPRNCIGARFAIYPSKLGIITILRNHKVEVCDKTMIPYVFDPTGFLLLPKGGLYLKFTKVDN
ncbi:uncharacterized protein LOC143431015 [Xylocopa sonorina]|uniref:uncharacterized protein LOC143431015 n=1 Tax=Xylocopa sonorina TaxID=1818115 RepID=UPI00403B13C7